MRHRPVLQLALACCIVLAVFPAYPSGATDRPKNETELLRLITPAERFTYFGLQYLMNRHQRRQYLRLVTEPERREWLERFWIIQDPTPATERNERKIEHELRVTLARKLFGMKKAPGWDKRGETLIRFGMPATRTKTFGDIGFYRMVPPGEIWYYRSLDMIVEFQDYNLKGEHIYAIKPQGITARQELDRMKELNQMMTSGLLQQIHPTQHMSYEELKDASEFNPDNIDYLADPDLRAEQPKDLIAIIEKEKYQEKENNWYKYMKENPVIFSFELEHELLPAYFDITSFEAGAGKLRTEINLEVPSRELKFVQQEGILNAELHLRVLARDARMRQVDLGGDVIRASQTGGMTFDGPTLLPGQAVLTLDPGYYRLGIEAIDLKSGRRGVFNTNIELATSGGALALSDIQFASTIRETQENVKFAKGNLQVVPHPIRAYRIPFPVSIYFEVYGLDTDSGDLAFYTVSYEITPLTKRRRGPVLEEIETAISQSFETTGYGSKQVQRLTIATDDLWEGAFLLRVRVTDRRARKTIEKTANFSILK